MYAALPVGPMPGERADVADRYLVALDAGELDGMLDLFADGAVVRSPLRGEVPAGEFFADLFEETERSDITPIQTFQSAGDGAEDEFGGDGDRFAAAFFRYDWTLKDGRSASFECVDVFELDAEGRIERLTLVYDAEDVRRQLGDGP